MTHERASPATAAASCSSGDATDARAGADVAAHLDACGECRSLRRIASARRRGLAGRGRRRVSRQRAGTDERGRRARWRSCVSSPRWTLALASPSACSCTPRDGRRRSAGAQRAAAAWRALVRRPRFAWEVAYVATLVRGTGCRQPGQCLGMGRPAGECDRAAASRQGRRPVSGRISRSGASGSTRRRRPPATGDVPPVESAADSQGAFDAAWQSASRWVRGRLARDGRRVRRPVAARCDVVQQRRAGGPAASCRPNLAATRRVLLSEIHRLCKEPHMTTEYQYAPQTPPASRHAAARPRSPPSAAIASSTIPAASP